MITIFSAPKPFTDLHIATIQRNAIQSWIHLGKDVEVFLIGAETGMAEVAEELGVRQLPDVRRNAVGTPLVSSMFALARQHSTNPFLLCVNADILLLPDLIQAAQHTAAQVQQFLLIGQRWDLEVRQLLDFSVCWDERLRADVQARGRAHLPSGSDYFLFPRELFAEMPDFAIGRAGWDNWMIYQARRQQWPVIDATPSLLVVHQDHDYSHLPGGKPHYTQAESFENQALAGGSANLYMLLDCDRELRDGRLQRPRPTLMRTLRRAEVWLTPPDGRRQGLRWFLARRLRRLRRRLTGSVT